MVLRELELSGIVVPAREEDWQNSKNLLPPAILHPILLIRYISLLVPRIRDALLLLSSLDTIGKSKELTQ